MNRTMLALLVVMLALIWSGCATTTETPKTLTEADNGTTLNLKLGGTLTLRLSENPTTGFSWSITTTDGLVVESDKYAPEHTDRVGAGGAHEWVLRATKEGTQRITGIYKRPWMNTTGTEKTFELTVNVS
ncbi:protease inhibitor I42 family protein [Methermicoccus shengliensis]|uniref:Proteinase inhibitor I42 chagasin domain-containing protein n=1 Tax=Methermicoccus shengliensis TaxID=660064 RepID=A0A832RSX5_9EURY|nr:protease inhibitor I42 family protein [Methermicoccus shengliensis]KUK30311.1 MAG: Uncharacterized protein XD62_0574 [Methanosarcinales archeaon 56_1174]MDI3487861.1 inhibitor of cysteine peptidase [Methanosarcinales archaeon]HIH69778.1 hypothetical protein [Methermicoccus shengliensis]